MIVMVLLIPTFLLVGCRKNEENKNTVTMYMWGGSQNINQFMDEKIAPEIKNRYGIELNRVAVVDIKDTVNKLIVEKNAGRKIGSIDIIWVNGENFKTLKKSEVLLGGLNEKIENVKLLKVATLEKDFGVNIEGFEIPWGEAQFNFIYNPIKQEEIPFLNHETLKEYVVNNPGRFTYPNVSNFTGSAFVRNIAIDIIGSEKIEGMSEEELKNELSVVWKYLKEIEPYLWRKGETYPESESMVDILYGRGELDITMGYTINKVTAKIESGEYPRESKSFLLNRGTLFNNHYLAIPKNSPNIEGALKVINFLISPEGQILKQDPKNWGDFTVLDYSKLDNHMIKEFDRFIQGDKIPSIEELKKKRVRELSPEKARIIDYGWMENIGKK